jgi:hypothetical protein
MAVTVSYPLEYRDKGQEVVVNIDISFISNWARREYGLITDIGAHAAKSWARVQEIDTEIEKIMSSGDENYIEQIEPYKAEVEKLTNEIKAAGEPLFKRRFELIKEILETNNVEGDEFRTFDFWDRKVEADTTVNFLSAVVYKDIDFGKKQAAQR